MFGLVTAAVTESFGAAVSFADAALLQPLIKKTAITIAPIVPKSAFFIKNVLISLLVWLFGFAPAKIPLQDGSFFKVIAASLFSY
jgi:hypothetical protein